MLLSILAVFHPVISFAASSVTNAQDAGRAIALGAGAGGGAAGAGAGIGSVFGASIQAKTRQPELRGDIERDQWLGFALDRGLLLLRPRRRIHRLLPLGRRWQRSPHISRSPPAARSSSPPNVGLMVWVLVVFFISFFVLRKSVFPAIRGALDARAKTINDSIDAAEHQRREADELLKEYRERLKEARGQAEQIVSRARQTAETHEREASAAAKASREQMMEQTRRDIEAETRRAIQEIRREVADLTVMATEKVTRKVLTEDDQRRLIDEAMSELDFTALGAAEGS